MQRELSEAMAARDTQLRQHQTLEAQRQEILSIRRQMEQEETQFLTRIRETLPGLAPRGPVGDQRHLRAETLPDLNDSSSLSSELSEDHRRSDNKSYTRL